MAIKASAQITISKVIDIYACYRYYKLQSSTLAKPDKPTTNPPSGWSDTEPAYVSGSTNTLYFVDCNVYSDKTFTFSEVSKSSTYEAAKDAWNKANNAQESIDNLEIGGRNLARKTSSEWTNWWVPTANKVNICTVLSYIYPGSIKVGDIFTVSFDIDIKKFTKSVDGNLKVSIQGSVDGSWTIVNPFGRYDITNKITSNDCTEHITYIAKIGSEAQASSSKFDFGIRCDYSDGTGKLRLKNLKVERGNKATDWTPAPEDAISTVSTEYYLSTSATSLSGGSWSTTAPTWVNGKYMWSRTVITDGAGNKTYSPNQNGVCIAGAKGAKGDKGDTGAAGPTGPQGQTGAAGKDGQMLYATCNTAAGTVAKVASLAAGSLSLKAGATVVIKFTYANTASSPTLNIAGTGAKAMYIQGVRDVYWNAGATVSFTYDGTNWRVSSEPVYASSAIIGNPSGFNIYMDGSVIYMRNGTTVLAAFGANNTRIGLVSNDATLDLCCDHIKLGTYVADGIPYNYLRSKSMRIGSKAPNEAGASLSPSIKVDEDGAYINEILVNPDWKTMTVNNVEWRIRESGRSIELVANNVWWNAAHGETKYKIPLPSGLIPNTNYVVNWNKTISNSDSYFNKVDFIIAKKEKDGFTLKSWNDAASSVEFNLDIHVVCTK